VRVIDIPFKVPCWLGVAKHQRYWALDDLSQHSEPAEVRHNRGVITTKAELAALLQSLQDTTNRIDNIARDIRSVEGREQESSELMAIEAGLRNAQRRLAKMVERMRA
jgi:predicted  nucleic acid-binding Zn-ribbon protein